MTTRRQFVQATMGTTLLATLGTRLAQAEPIDPPAPAAQELSASELNELRGGQAVAVNTANVTTFSAENAGNSVNGETVTTGALSISPDAFSGFDGVGNFVMNTGNNNNLQGSISITVVMTP